MCQVFWFGVNFATDAFHQNSKSCFSSSVCLASAANPSLPLNSRFVRFFGLVSFSRLMQFIRIRKVVSLQVCACVCVWNIWTDVKLLPWSFSHVTCCGSPFLFVCSTFRCNLSFSSCPINFPKIQQGDWSRFAYPVQRSYGISVDEWSDQPLVPAFR